MRRILGKLSLLTGAIGLSLSLASSAVGQTDVPEFSRIQPDTFGGNMALSNAWGDYDNDGDLDILLSGDTGSSVPTTKLYRNNTATANTPRLNVGLRSTPLVFH